MLERADIEVKTEEAKTPRKRRKRKKKRGTLKKSEKGKTKEVFSSILCFITR